MFFKTLITTLVLSLSIFTTSAQAYNELKGVVLTIYVNPQNPPFSTLSSDYKTAIGLDIEIIKELQKRLGFELTEGRVLPLLRADQLRKMKEGQCDMLGGSLSVTKKREQYMHFTPIYFDSGLGILYSEKYNAGKIKDINDLANKKVAVIDNTSAQSYMENLGTAQLRVVQNFTRAALGVAYGKVDAFIYDKPIIESFAEQMSELQLAVTEDLFSRESAQYAFGLPKDSPYSEIIDKEIQNMIYDGTMSDLIGKYFQ